MNLTEIHNEALSVIAQYGIRDTTVEWDNSRSRLGVCRFLASGRRIVSFSRLTMAAVPEEVQMDTILHELAHARLPHTAGHGPEWKAIHRSMGGNGEAEYNNRAIALAVSKWHCTCSMTGELLGGSNRLTQKQRNLACACHQITVTWKVNN